MASVHPKRASSFWFAFWPGPCGKLRDRSTKLTNRSKALKTAIEFERMEEFERLLAAADDCAPRSGVTRPGRPWP